MKNLIQKYFMAIVAVMMVVGFSAFKVIDTMGVPNDKPENGWYNINITDDEVDYDEPWNQTIGTFKSETLDPGCSPLNEEEPCAVYLEFDNYSGPLNILDMNVSYVTDTLHADISPL